MERPGTRCWDGARTPGLTDGQFCEERRRGLLNICAHSNVIEAMRTKYESNNSGATDGRQAGDLRRERLREAALAHDPDHQEQSRSRRARTGHSARWRARIEAITPKAKR